ncbi:hypothetical protein D5S17_23810 [Pseudonocardiaceae bacterium YIM PH 21723]|nr:hypothetical protein D5S17_23810 [Pseudonocardiaceae bacterium YIM PH 21723]
MNENELKNAFRDVLAASSPPPAMNPDHALTVGRKAKRRRNANLMSAGAAAVVLLVAGGSVWALGNGASNTIPASPVRSTATSSASAAPAEPKYIAQPGSRAYEQVVKLQALLPSVLDGNKDGWRLAENNRSNKLFQAEFQQHGHENREVWRYNAIIAVAKGNGQQDPEAYLHELRAQVFTSASTLGLDLCQRAHGWNPDASGLCSNVRVDGKDVVVYTPEDSRMGEMGAIYRWPDGTVVYFGQRKPLTNSSGGYVLTPEALARAAADPKFKLD